MKSWPSKLQKEHGDWHLKKFGANVPRVLPVLGMIEELGEFYEAMMRAEGPKYLDPTVIDAVGDTIIFMAGLCNAAGWSLLDLHNMGTYCRVKDWETRIPVLMGGLAHCELKTIAGTRGGSAVKEAQQKALCAEVFSQMAHAVIQGHGLENAVQTTWAKVLQESSDRTPTVPPENWITPQEPVEACSAND